MAESSNYQEKVEEFSAATDFLQVIFSYHNFDIAEQVLKYLCRSDIHNLRSILHGTENCVLHDVLLLFRIKISPELKIHELKEINEVWKFITNTLVTEVLDHDTKVRNSQSLCDLLFSEKLIFNSYVLILYLQEPLITFIIFKEIGHYLIDQLLVRCTKSQMQSLYDLYIDASGLHIAAELNEIEIVQKLLPFFNIHNKYSKLTGKTIPEVAHLHHSLDVEQFIAFNPDWFWQFI